MTRKHWLLLLVLFGITAGGVTALVWWLLSQDPPEPLTTGEMANLVVTDLPAAQKKYLNRRLRVQGVVKLSLPVPDAEEPFTMIEFETAQGLDVQAAFSGREPPALEIGDEVVIEGECALCERGVLYFQHCRLVSASKAGRAPSK